VVVLTPLQGVEIARHGLAVDAPGWLAIVYMGVFPTFIGYLLQQQAIKHLGVSKAALFINLVPVMVMVLAVVVLGETFLPLNLVSAAMIIASVLGFSLMAGTAGSAPRPAAAPAAPSALPPPPAPGARP
jgi:drug/metabolite transporter (DMT)-like permease